MSSCSICTIQPNSHSFSIYNETKDHVWFYSSDHYLDRNTDHIISHIRGELEEFHKNNPQKKWSWLFDSHEFEFRWETISMISELIKVIELYKNTFICIRIIRTNEFVKKTLSFCKEMINDDMMSKIKIDDIKGVD